MNIFTLRILFSLLLASNIFGLQLSSNNTENSLIIYNSSIGLVHEKRALELSKNDTQIIYEDVASTINTDSVNVSFPNSISLFSQQYRYDKLTQKKLLDAHIGKTVQVQVMRNSTDFKIITATLLSNDGKTCIVKENENIITVESKNIIFTSIPNELITKPSLVWNVQNKKNITANMSIDYLINNITWKSDYILNLSGDEADLTGWISIDNRSGKAFKDTDLHVLAGDINRAIQPRQNYRVAKSMMVQEAMPVASHQAYEGYHFYTIPFKVNLANNEKTQLKFISQNDISFKRKYIARMSNPNHLRGELKRDVTQHITINSLEYPLPKGVVRTYSKLQNTNILLGETSIKHTPKNTSISLKLGKNLDIKVTETLNKRDIGTWTIEEDVKYSIKNSSDENKKIQIQIPFNKRDGSKIKTSKKYTFTKGNLLTFDIKVQANSTKEFEVFYTVKKK